MLAPFIASYCALDLAQDCLVYLTDRAAQRRGRLGRVPLAEEAEVLGLVVCRRVVAAAGEQGVGGAGARGADEARPQLVLIIARHQRAVNDSAEVVAVLVEIHLRELARGVLKLRGQPFALRAEVLRQAEPDFAQVAVVDCPWAKRPRIAPRARVRDVENIPQPRRGAAVIYKCYAFCPSPNVSAHAPRPHVVLGTRARVRPLRVYEHLVSEVVFVVAGHRGKQPHPLGVTVRDSAERVMCERGDAA